MASMARATRERDFMTAERSENFETAEFFTYLLSQGTYSDIRDLGNGHYACIVDFIFTKAIITGRIGQYQTYNDRWCYSSYEKAKAGLDAWDGTGEPEGWHRHPNTGRRREFDDLGEMTREYVNP